LFGGGASAAARTARPGFRATPFLLPFGAGLLAASAASSLARDRNAYCNGRTIMCYRAACEQALASRCPDAAAANATLQLVPCPDSRAFSECYRTMPGGNDLFNSSSSGVTGTVAPVFECFGVRRPRFGNEDVTALCHQPDAGGARSNGAGSSRRTGSTVRVCVCVWWWWCEGGGAGAPGRRGGVVACRRLCQPSHAPGRRLCQPSHAPGRRLCQPSHAPGRRLCQPSHAPGCVATSWCTQFGPYTAAAVAALLPLVLLPTQATLLTAACTAAVLAVRALA
jgi:hypothetical protein